MHHSWPTDLILSGVSVGLENAFELTKKLPRPITSTTEAEVERQGSSWATILPEIGLVVLPTALVHLHINRGFIRLNVIPGD
jgi:hypothetical protein